MMNKALMAILVAASAAAAAQGYDVPSGSGYGQGFAAEVSLANAPGGAYIQCDPKSKSSPIRCTPDDW
jgi:hypothetical protein